MVWKPHATVAAVIEQNQRFLMVEEGIDGKLVVNQPAGHLDDNESLLQAVVREVLEETAWTFIPQGIVGVYRWCNPTNERTYLRTTFFGQVSKRNPEQKLDEPIVKADWYRREQLEQENLRSPLVLRCINDYNNGQRYPLEILIDV